MFKQVNITCTNRDMSVKADVIECRADSMKVAIHGTNMPITLRQQGGVYVGNSAGLEFVCNSSYHDIIGS